jgi:hypothetical protein
MPKIKSAFDAIKKNCHSIEKGKTVVIRWKKNEDAWLRGRVEARKRKTSMRAGELGSVRKNDSHSIESDRKR